ncbi:hypothetical protein ASF98_21315 [Arthrobacter sp. Leaf337]|nr:hypothetical protein ASF98_21315 [Arthrobacter sp. Leaf337]
MNAAHGYVQRRKATAWAPPEKPPGPADLAAAREILAPATLYRFVQGVDAGPEVMKPEQRSGLNDPMAATFFNKGLFPLTLGDVMAGLDDAGAVPGVKSYLVGETGQIPPDEAPQLERDFRFAIVRGGDSKADLMISTSAADASEAAFLQIASWDDSAGVFNYYMRLDATWVWSGNSYTALAPESRGQACFDSHANGSVVMKELTAPWMHWQSQNSTILLASDSPVRSSPYYQSPPLTGAEDLETTVRAAVDRWTVARLRSATASETIEHPDWLLRQLCTSTTVNLATSPVEFKTLSADAAFSPPLGLWFNSEALLNTLAIPADISLPAMNGGDYLHGVSKYEFALEAEGFTRKGDSFFAFAVPVPAFEDLNVIDHLVASGTISAKFAACVLMVDFCNPLFSARRTALMRYCPTGSTAPDVLTSTIADAIVTAAGHLTKTSPEFEFAAYWMLTDEAWPKEFAQKIEHYMTSVNRRIATPAGVDDYIRLSESRRREFKAMKINEFTLTLPVTNIPANAPLLDTRPDGTVGPRTPDLK